MKCINKLMLAALFASLTMTAGFGMDPMAMTPFTNIGEHGDENGKKSLFQDELHSSGVFWVMQATTMLYRFENSSTECEN
ncbi:MAG: hypothetical protein US22_C0031G0001, partial [candidate division TM6 bacterium GW2011_GWF2_36_6]